MGDTVYKSKLLSKLVKNIVLNGNYLFAEKIFYKFMRELNSNYIDLKLNSLSLFKRSQKLVKSKNNFKINFKQKKKKYIRFSQRWPMNLSPYIPIRDFICDDVERTLNRYVIPFIGLKEIKRKEKNKKKKKKKKNTSILCGSS